MSRQTHRAWRRGNHIYVEIFDGRRNTQKTAAELGSTLLGTHEVGLPPERVDGAKAWTVEVDPLRSHSRSQIIEMVLADMDQVDAASGLRWPTIDEYLEHLAGTLETLAEDAPIFAPVSSELDKR